MRGGPCLHFLSLTPAYYSQIVLRTVSDPFALQEVIKAASPPSAVVPTRNFR